VGPGYPRAHRGKCIIVMGRKVSIPVRVVRPTEYQTGPRVKEADDPARTAGPAPGSEAFEEHMMDEKTAMQASTVQEEPAPWRGRDPGLEADADEWRDRALRLQAEMDNYRKRQQRLAQSQIEAERERLLSAFLGVVDDLERALTAPAAGGEGLRRGVELTHRAAVQLLQKEDVKMIEAEGRPFDPNWHEAVATVSRNGSGVAPNTVIRVMEPGYRLGDRLLRPAKVVVAV
jgi:molecular chaperone GrpE